MDGAVARLLRRLLLLVAFVCAPLAARADDAGPAHDVRAIRHDLPILLADHVLNNGFDPKSVQIDDVVVSADEALADWHVAGVHTLRRIEWMNYRYGRWWIEHDIFVAYDGTNAWCCGGYYSAGSLVGPDPSYLARISVPPQLIALAQEHLAIVRAAQVAASPTPSPCPTAPCLLPKVGLHGDGYLQDRLHFTHETTEFVTPNLGGYHVTIVLAASDAAPNATVADISGRAPTRGESWLTPNNDAFYFLSGTVRSATTIHVRPGSTIDVWFPFVLDPTWHYTLTIAGKGGDSLVNLPGTLARNTLHFVLPAFALAPGIDVYGEIDGDPPSC